MQKKKNEKYIYTCHMCNAINKRHELMQKFVNYFSECKSKILSVDDEAELLFGINVKWIFQRILPR